jgi:serine/threonine-protein kinase
MALEYVEGRNLRDYLARKGPPDLAVALSILRQAAAALQRAGEMGIIHRDVKPENILLTRKGEVKVADFGLSRCFAGDQPPLHLTQTGVTMGSPLYMSPEQVEGKPLDPRTDIYSLGVTCYHMLAGQPPFRGDTAFQVALQHVQSEPAPLAEVRPDLPPELGAVVHKMMAKDPDQRYQTAGDLLEDLARLRQGLSLPKPAPVESTPLPAASGKTVTVPAARPRSWLVAAFVGSLLAAAGLGAVLGRGGFRPAVETEPQSPPAPADDGISALFSPTERERFLNGKVQEFANPGGDVTRRRQGLDFLTELGLIYLNQWRLDEADRFFSELINNPNRVKEYVTLGRVGRACVLAYRNHPGESNKLFRELASTDLPVPKRFDGTPLFLRIPQLRYAIARALDYNAANATEKEPFPSDLEYLRRPQAIVPRAPEKGK